MVLSWLQETVIARDLAAVGWSSRAMLISFCFMFLNPLFWNSLGRLEYKCRLLSKLFRGNSKAACYALAASIFILGLYRDYLFTRAVKGQPSTELLSGWISSWLGPILMATGYLFVVTSTLRLGIIGTFLGDYFGFLMRERVTSFPFNICNHPMYEGSTMIFLGYSLWNKSLAGLGLTAAIALAYSIASHFEGNFTTMIYSRAATKKLRTK